MARWFWVAVLVASLAGTQPAPAKSTVVIGELSWPGADVIANVLEQVMTENLNVSVSTIFATESALYESMNKGDGSVDVVPDMWTDHLGQQLRKYVLPGSR